MVVGGHVLNFERIHLSRYTFPNHECTEIERPVCHCNWNNTSQQFQLLNIATWTSSTATSAIPQHQRHPGWIQPHRTKRVWNTHTYLEKWQIADANNIRCTSPPKKKERTAMTKQSATTRMLLSLALSLPMPLIDHHEDKATEDPASLQSVLCADLSQFFLRCSQSSSRHCRSKKL